MASRKLLQLGAPGFSTMHCWPVQILEDFLRRAHRLLEDVVDSGEPLDRLVQHQQRDDEAGELAGASSAAALICCARRSAGPRW